MQIPSPNLGRLLEYSFKLHLKPFSINNYHYRDKRHKTADARDWERQVDIQLQSHLTAFADIAAAYKNKPTAYFVLNLHAYYPPQSFFTQSGEVSGRTVDSSNWEKPMQDMLFKALGLNDKLVKRLVSEKSPGSHHYIEVTIKLEGLYESNVV